MIKKRTTEKITLIWTLRLRTHSGLRVAFVIFFGTFTPASFWGGCFALSAFRGVVCNSFRVQQIFNLASQHLCYPPELVNVRAFPMPCTPALYCAIAQTSPAAKLPAADPCGLAALVYGVPCMRFSHGVALLFIQYTADAVKMEEQNLPYKRGNVWTLCRLCLLRVYGKTQPTKDIAERRISI